VKVNGKSDKRVHYYRRLPSGVLRQVRPDVNVGGRDMILNTLEAAIIDAAKRGYPFMLSGVSGLYQQRHRLPAELHTISKQGLEKFGQELLNAGRLVKGTAKGVKGRTWLDAPTGDFAMGHGMLQSGSGVAV
jgi:hypothetical protein